MQKTLDDCFGFDVKDRVIEVKTFTSYYNDTFHYDEGPFTEERFPHLDEEIRKELTLVTTYTNQEGEAERFYWSGQKLLTEADAAMNLKVMEYNDSEQVVAETDALGRTTKFGYDRWGNVEKVIDANGGTEFRLRDANGDLYKRIDKAGHEFNFALDKYGKPFEVSGPEGLFYSLKYNQQGQVEEIREGQIFDDEGNVAEEGASLYLDPETDKRPATRFAYDRYNRLKERKEADGTVHRYKYDCRGNLLRLTYPDGGLSVFDYDEAGRMVKATLCDGRTMRWAYDARGNVVEQTDGRGAKTSYQYDAYDLLKSVTNPKGDAVELSYDGALRLREVKNALGETYSFERDDAGRVVEEHDFAGRTLKYRLDKAGQVTERLGADNLVTALSYDKLGQLTEVAVFDGELDEKTGKREPRKTAYAYDILGRVTDDQWGQS